MGLAERAGDPLLGSSALDCRCCTCLGTGDLAGAMAAITERRALLAGLRDGSSRASVEQRDLLSMSCDVTLRLGDSRELPFLRAPVPGVREGPGRTP